MNKRQVDDNPLTGGESFGSYYIDVEVGTPPQKLRMDPDTGSADFVVVTPECGCSKWGQGFAPTHSITANLTQCGTTCVGKDKSTYVAECQRCCVAADSCTFKPEGQCGVCSVDISYVDGSQAKGSVYLDFLTTSAGSPRVPIYVGAMSETGGKFSNLRNDGVMGLANRGISLGIPTFMDQLFKTRALTNNSFATCYGSYDQGQLVLGGYDPHLVASHNASFQSFSVPMDMSSGFYSVSPIGFAMEGGKHYTIGQGVSALLDTGTTLLITKDSFFPSLLGTWILDAASRVLTASAMNRVNQVLENPTLLTCFSAEELASFLPCLPPLQVLFKGLDGATHAVPIRMTSVFWILESSKICPQPGPGPYAISIGIEQGETGDFDMVFGDTFLRNVYTEWDRENGIATFRPPNSSLCGVALPGVTDTDQCIGDGGGGGDGPGIPRNILIGIIAGAAVVVIAGLILLVVCCCRRRSHHHHHHQDRHQIKYSRVPQRLAPLPE